MRKLYLVCILLAYGLTIQNAIQTKASEMIQTEKTFGRDAWRYLNRVDIESYTKLQEELRTKIIRNLQGADIGILQEIADGFGINTKICSSPSISSGFVIEIDDIPCYQLAVPMTVTFSETKSSFSGASIHVNLQQWQESFDLTPATASSDGRIVVRIVCANTFDTAKGELVRMFVSGSRDIHWYLSMYKVEKGPGDACLVHVDNGLLTALFGRSAEPPTLNDNRVAFIRGNVAVYLVSYYKDFGCMDLAMKLDAFLLKEAKRQSRENVKPPELLEKEPRNISEFNSMLISSLESQEFTYVIGTQQMSILDNEDFESKQIQARVNFFASSAGAKMHFREYLISKRFSPADAVAGLNHQYSITPRNFFFSEYNDDQIGNMSFERKFGIWEDDPTNYVFFIRGNCVIAAWSPSIGFRYGADRTIELMTTPDPREIAWRIDQYLKDDPLEKFGDDERAKLRTLEITLPQEAEFEQGSEYPLDFARKLPDGTVPAEVRLVVSRGEIQQVIDKAESENSNAFPNPASLAPDIDGKYTVLFGQPGKQTVHCYHINEEGKCLAWGEIEVQVKAVAATILENDGGTHD